MAPLLDMETQTVYTAGQNVTSLKGQAGSAGRGFLSSITNAEATVEHDTVKTALKNYFDEWSQPANRMEHDVDALGGNTSSSASAVSTGNADATTAGYAPASLNQDLGARLNTGGVLAV